MAEDRNNLEASQSWYEYRRLVIANLQTLEDSVNRIENAISQMKIDIAMLQVKSGVWGIAGGALIVVAAMLRDWVVKK